MAKKFTFNLQLYENAVKERAVPVVVQTTNELYMEILKNSPVATGQFLNWNQNLGVSELGNKVIGKIKNRGEYSERVEYGFRRTPVNWHLRSGMIYFDIGAMPFQRSIEIVKQRYLNNLQRALG